MIQNRLNRLLALNKSAPRAYRIETNADEATVYLYDIVGYDGWTGGGVTAKQFANDLSGIAAKTLHLRINSPGGDVFDGRAMVAALNAHPAHKIAHIDGLAASAASFIAMHADEIVMTEGSFMMIHNGWTMAVGDRHAMTETVARLEKIDASIVDDYAKKTGMEREDLAKMMDQETWMSASEALSMGFADRIAGTEQDGKTKAGAWNLSAYETPPKTEPVPEPEPQEDRSAIAAHAERLRTITLAEIPFA